MHDIEARQAYEMRSLDSLGDAAPHVRLCSGDVDECCELIFDFLCGTDGMDEYGYGSDGDLDLSDEEHELMLLSKSLALENLAATE